MLRFVVRRLIQLIPILLGLSIILFAWVHALPGGPAEGLLGERATPARIAQVRHDYGLDRPLYVQYGAYMNRTVRFDFGQSIATQRSVSGEIQRRFPATVELSLAAMVFAIGLGIPLGFLAAKRVNGPSDHFSMAGSLLGISIPVFFLAYLLKYVFAVKLHWLPSIGRLSPTRQVRHPTGFFVLDGILTLDLSTTWDALRHLILPAIALGTIPLAIITRITRAAVLEVSDEDYVRTAEAKGMTAEVVNIRHILRNAMLPIVTIVGLQTGLLLAGAVLTELVFAWGGIGSFLYQGIVDRDFPVIEGGVLFVAVVIAMVNLLVDVTYGVLDPRIRVS
ncbi:MAG: ABC transporter permease [Actinomycetota bacterium]|nr:ABC transporter permease [Actinomycetota bacterium]